MRNFKVCPYRAGEFMAVQVAHKLDNRNDLKLGLGVTRPTLVYINYLTTRHAASDRRSSRIRYWEVLFDFDD